MEVKKLDIECVARAVEDDAGESWPDLRQALAEFKAGDVGRVTAPEQSRALCARQAIMTKSRKPNSAS